MGFCVFNNLEVIFFKECNMHQVLKILPDIFWRIIRKVMACRIKYFNPEIKFFIISDESTTPDFIARQFVVNTIDSQKLFDFIYAFFFYGNAYEMIMYRHMWYICCSR